MHPAEILLESKWNLSIGTELANPKNKELAVVRKISNYDLQDPAQLQEFKDLVDDYREKQELTDQPMISVLNNPEESRFAHVVEISIDSGDRKGQRVLYISYDSKADKVWSSYAGTTGRSSTNLSTAKGRKNLEDILKVNLLPVDVVSSRSANRRMNAGEFWQVTDVGAIPNRSRDRIKPNQISKLYNLEADFWKTHPEVKPALNAYIQANKDYDLTKTKDNKNKVDTSKKEFEIALADARTSGPSDEMLDTTPLTVTGVRDSIGSSKARSSGVNRYRSFYPKRKKEYLQNLLEVFITQPDSPSKIYPMTIIDNVETRSTLVNIGIAHNKSVITDFMEVVHPVAVITGNTTGNAQKMILDYLGASSFEELMKTASISYGSNNTGKLIDSVVYNKTPDGIKKLQISSKSGSGEAASVKSLAVAYDEVMKNQASKKMWDEEITQNKEYKDATDFLTTVLDNQDISWKVCVDYSTEQDLITQNDKKLINELAVVLKKNVKDKDEEEYDSELNEAIGNRTSETIVDEFSPELKELISEGPFAEDAIWPRVIGSLWNQIINFINSTTSFGNLVVWLFNHSATIQVNTRSHEMKDKDATKLVLTNITSTWPTQLVETAELTLGRSSSTVIKFSLKVDGYVQVLDTADISTPLENRTDVKGMPTSADPQRPDRDATRDKAGDLTDQEKLARFKRKVGSGTDNTELPAKSTRLKPDGTPEQEKTGQRSSRVSFEVVKYREEVNRILDFIKKINSDFDNSRGIRKIDSVLKLARNIYTTPKTPSVDSKLRELYGYLTDLITVPKEWMDDVVAGLNIDPESGLSESINDELKNNDIKVEELQTIIHILYYAIVAKYYNNIDRAKHDQAYANLEKIESQLGLSEFSDYRRGSGAAVQKQATELSRQATEKSSLDLLINDNSVSPQIKRLIRGISKIERRYQVDNRGIRTLVQGKVPDTEMQGEAAALYFDLKKENLTDDEILQDLQDSYGNLLNEGKKSRSRILVAILQ